MSGGRRVGEGAVHCAHRLGHRDAQPAEGARGKALQPRVELGLCLGAAGGVECLLLRREGEVEAQLPVGWRAAGRGRRRLHTAGKAVGGGWNRAWRTAG